MLVPALLLDVLVVAFAAVIIGHLAWRTSVPSAIEPNTPSTPSTLPNGFGGSGNGAGGNGFRGSGFGSGDGSGTGSSASGGPADASAIAKAVDSGLVDIDTTLSYESEEAAGTGMVITNNGEILTNNHVIEGATSISVTDVGNGHTYTGHVVGYDRTKDVAVVQLTGASGLQRINIGDSSTVKAGQSVVGIGNAGGAGGTPSYAGGAVVGLNQSITASDSGDGTSEQLAGLIETNAAIEPGDSGGPLVNSNRKVIAMDTAASAGFEFQSQGGATEGFAIPINEALQVASSIVAGTESTAVHIGATAFLGVRVEQPGQGGFGFGSGFGNETPSSGAQIVQVVPGSPAAQAGLSSADTITRFDGKSITSPNALTTIIEGERPGTTADVSYLDAQGASHTIKVNLTSGPPQ